MRGKLFAMLAVVLLMSVLSTAMGQTREPFGYPNRPLRLLVSAPAGSPPDVAGRIVSEPLSTALGQPIVVDNRPGASGTLGLHAVAKAAPDGYTLGIITMLHAAAPGMVRQMPYDTNRDLAPIAQLTWAATILVVRSSSPIKSTADLVAAAKRTPGKITYASAGNGTPSHLAAELFRRHAGVDLLHVPFKGIGPGITAIIGEQIDMAFAGAATVTPFIKSGRLRALGTAAPRRLPVFPDLPTIAEQGFADFNVREWHGIVAPAGTPAKIVATLAQDIARVVAIPEVTSRLAAVGLQAAEGVGQERFAAHLQSELARWTKVIGEAGIRAD